MNFLMFGAPMAGKGNFAKALAKRLAILGFDEIYSSSSIACIKIIPLKKSYFFIKPL